MSEHSFKTWGDVLKYLQTLTYQQLEQRPMVMPHQPDDDKVVNLLPVVVMITVEETELETRSAEDWNHHPEQVVLLTDLHPFDGEGNLFYTLEDEGGRGNNTGKLYTNKELDDIQPEE